MVDYLLDIVSEQASLRTFGDRKGAVLSLEDLAELRKTMVSIRHGSSDATVGSGASDKDESEEGGGPGDAATSGRVLVPIEGIALGPAARVLAMRRWLTAYRTVSKQQK